MSRILGIAARALRRLRSSFCRSQFRMEAGSQPLCEIALPFIQKRIGPHQKRLGAPAVRVRKRERGESMQSEDVFRIEPQRVTIMLLGFVESALSQEKQSKRAVMETALRFAVDCKPQEAFRFERVAVFPIEDSQSEIDLRRSGSDLQSTLEIGVSFRRLIECVMDDSAIDQCAGAAFI